MGVIGFNWNDYVLVLPITLLTLFALGILLIDLMIPPNPSGPMRLLRSLA